MSRSLFGNRLYPVFGASAAESRRNERGPKIRRALSGVENHPDDGQTCVGVHVSFCFFPLLLCGFWGDV